MENSKKNITPIFIASLPRSGSTLLQNILSNNNEVATTSEPWILIPLFGLLKEDYKSKTNTNLTKSAIEEFLLEKTGVDLQENIKHISNSLYNKNINGIEKYFLDKTPRYYEYLNEIIETFPESKIIILKRDVCDVVNSIIETWNIDSIYKMRSFKRDILDAPKIMQDFLDTHVNNQNVKSIKYEDLVSNPKKIIKDLYTWLGLDYNNETLDFTQNDKTKGKFGDPTGVQKNKKPKKSPKSREILNDKYWKEFIIGYLNELNLSFLKKYGYNYSFKVHKTMDFNLYKYSCFSKRVNSRTAIANILANFKFQIFTTKYNAIKIHQDIDILP